MAIKGLDKVQANLKAVQKRILAAELNGREKAGDALLAEAKARAPKRTGHLASTGFNERQGDTVVTGFSADYALTVHEDLEAQHPNGEAKFLETPAREKAPELLRIVAETIKREVGL